MTLGDMELPFFKTRVVGRDAMASATVQIFLRVFGMLVCKFFVQIFTVLSCIEAFLPYRAVPWDLSLGRKFPHEGSAGATALSKKNVRGEGMHAEARHRLRTRSS